MTIARRLLRDEDGLELVEYSLMAAIVIAVLIGAITGLGGAVAASIRGLTTVVGS